MIRERERARGGAQQWLKKKQKASCRPRDGSSWLCESELERTSARRGNTEAQTKKEEEKKEREKKEKIPRPRRSS